MRLSLFAVAALLASSLAARADTLTTFQLNGTFTHNATATGMIIIDITNGLVQSGTATLSGTTLDPNFTFSSQYGVGGGEYTIALRDSNNFFNVNVPVDTLVGYTGGSICSQSASCLASTNIDAFYIAISGSLTPISSVTTTAAVTPEPSSLALLGTGILGVFGVMKRRFA